MPTAKKAPPPEFEGIEGDPPEPTEPPEISPEDAEWMNAPLGPPLLDETPTPRGPRGLIDISGAAYLPARRRVQWMRGVIVEHPDWGIETDVVQYSVGTFKGTKRLGRQTVPDVAGGYALVKAQVIQHNVDQTGRDQSIIIAEGMAMEWSEMFPDFIEKAETSAIARALAVAGYGTESAVDFDEGPVADSPLRPDGTLGGGIFINGSSLPGVGVGAQQTQITEPQFQRIRELARTKQLDPLAMRMAVDFAFDGDDEGLDTLTEGFPANGSTDEQRAYILNTIRDMTFDEAAKLITTLELSDDPASP